ncbi:putative transcriptional regulator, GntR family protein [Streptomyces thermoviolaceus subsp. thermoviolaceus]|nr:putative transcriptional regulator, GntR family protein [Streptomyces thermoviolaceus subsp. apingens]GHB13503.1 putative transcriptional regulator, GntR family protein [Streptomyces thermoviolaceus subsp. thermoviolaceus]
MRHNACMTTQPKAADRAYAHIRESLLDGVYTSGDLLSEGTVAADLGISRTPVREAFQRLQNEGFLRVYPKRGAVVVPVGPEDAHGVLQARLLLELFALDALAARGAEAVRETGRALLRDCEQEQQGTTPSGARELGRTFHCRLVGSAGNPVVAGLYETLWNQQERIAAAATAGSAHAAQDVAEHAAIATALHEQRPAEARRLLADHLAAVLHRSGFSGRPSLPPEAGTSASA